MKIKDNGVFMDLQSIWQIYRNKASPWSIKLKMDRIVSNHPKASCSILIILLGLFGPIHSPYWNRSTQSSQSVCEREEADMLQVLCCINAECPNPGIKEHPERTLA